MPDLEQELVPVALGGWGRASVAPSVWHQPWSFCQVKNWSLPEPAAPWGLSSAGQAPRVIDSHKVPVATGTCFSFCCECKAWSPLPAAPAAPGAAMHVLVLLLCSFG